MGHPADWGAGSCIGWAVVGRASVVGEFNCCDGSQAGWSVCPPSDSAHLSYLFSLPASHPSTHPSPPPCHAHRSPLPPTTISATSALRPPARPSSPLCWAPRRVGLLGLVRAVWACRAEQLQGGASGAGRLQGKAASLWVGQSCTAGRGGHKLEMVDAGWEEATIGRCIHARGRRAF